MSRIHDALKKAELERAAIRGSARSAPTPSAVEARAESADSTTVAPASPTLNLEGADQDALAHIAAAKWNPEAATIRFMNGDDREIGTEEFRTLRSRLYTLREKTTLKVLLVTSALPKEGKSFTAANLAQVLVLQPERRVLLIDGDLRQPQLHRMLGTTGQPGLSDYLEGKCDEFSIMQRGVLESFFFIPSGTEILNPLELAANGRMKTLLQRLGPLFDWIVVDSPPVIPASDAVALAMACDGVLLVVRSDSTPPEMARKARRSFPEELLVGMVLNETCPSPTPLGRPAVDPLHGHDA